MRDYTLTLSHLYSYKRDILEEQYMCVYIYIYIYIDRYIRVYMVVVEHYWQLVRILAYT